MKPTRRSLVYSPLSALILLALNGCAMQSQWREAENDAVRQQDLGGLPYHPLAYHLDLCTLAYQTYGHTSDWP